MNTKIEIGKSHDTLRVLLVGNNPIDLGNILGKLQQIRSARVITEIAFDVKSTIDRLVRFKPNYIIIDDNIGKFEMSETVKTLAEKNKTKDIPIAVLKNSNYQESHGSMGILDYLLKTDLSPERLYATLRNSMKFRKTQLNLYKAYQKRKTARRLLS